MTHILFVCTGNTCRSPMAEALLKSKTLPKVEVKSAGVFASNGSGASRHTQKVLEDAGIPMDHQSALLTESLVNWSTWILTMTASHKSAVLSYFPQAAGKTFTLKEFAGEEDADIIDPYGGSFEIYQSTFKEMNAIIDKISGKLS